MHMLRTALLGAAVAAIEADQPGIALGPCTALLAGDPADADAHLLLGLAHGLAGDATTAADQCHIAHLAQPRAPHPCHSLAGLLRRHGRAECVAPQYEAALARAPADESLLLALADAYHEAGAQEQTIELLAPLLARAPDHVGAGLLAGIALADLGRIAPAIAHFRRLVVVAPETGPAWSNLGMLLKVEGAFDDALVATNRAVELLPDDPQIRVNRAVILLRAGRLGGAWSDYEHRLRLAGRGGLAPERALPVLSGLDNRALRGRTLLVTHEDGFGDSLQFLRYAPLLAERGLHVVAWMPRPLVRLLRGAVGVAEIVEAGSELPNFDFHSPVSSLPRVFETNLDSVPPPLDIALPPELVAHWRDRLGTDAAARRIGLVWAGQARPWLPGFSVLDGRRSLHLAALAALGQVAGVEWVSLQMGEAAGQQAMVCSPALRDVMGEVNDFADTAAIIAHLDAVVSVDTAIAHLAASLGKPVFLLDRYDSCWRWLAGRQDSPWYPGLRIFRQSEIGEWDSVIAKLVAALGG
jgi:Flp pilus assembly protein TadD